ncbi:4Fe-4S ferredoxin [Bacteroidia bacterium]|nr:4Fe-4S ferredoxin [Bacteroidia bacterium]
MTLANLRLQITRKAKQLGADLVGFAPVSRWEELNEVPAPFYPQHIFPFTRTVIVLAVPVFIPMVDTTPSVVYAELYNTTNRILDEMAYKLAQFINGKGHRSVYFPRDAYGDISALIDKPEAAFSHVLAAKYAGLGTIGFSHALLTKEYGPRVRLVSVFTDAELSPDPMPEKELCIHCELCSKCCPTDSLLSSQKPVADMDKHNCSIYHQQLKQRFCYPCGVCIKVCPIGNDRKLYGQPTQKYLKEKKDLGKEVNSNDYPDWTHIRNFGSL